MAIILDENVHAAIARRRARGQTDRLFLRIEAVPAHGGIPNMLSIGWAPTTWPRRAVEARKVDGIEIYMGPRVAQYTQWRDVKISGWRLGPLSHLVVVDELYVLLNIEAWVRSHPGLVQRTA